VKPWEVDEHAPNDVWIVIDGYFENIKTSWEQTRFIAYTAARFGNSDPKKFPKRPEQFCAFSWDKKQANAAEEKFKHYAEMKARRKLLENAAGRKSIG
jgi:hypothetical protein